jgi:divinyl protochlorophyllide a 8-vinyl-reductase
MLLKLLPAPLAARVLLAAITRNAWTFVGSGRFKARAGTPVQLTIQHNPLCVGVQSDTPACDFYAATFETLFRTLVHTRAQVREVECESCGASACRFEIRW